jgi:hypothetical protein
MRVLDGLADVDEKLETLANPKLGLVAEHIQRQSVHEFHHEVGAPVCREAAVEHSGDVGMVHQRQRLPLLLETGQHGLSPQLAPAGRRCRHTPRPSKQPVPAVSLGLVPYGRSLGYPDFRRSQNWGSNGFAQAGEDHLTLI